MVAVRKDHPHGAGEIIGRGIDNDIAPRELNGFGCDGLNAYGKPLAFCAVAQRRRKRMGFSLRPAPIQPAGCENICHLPVQPSAGYDLIFAVAPEASRVDFTTIWTKCSRRRTERFMTKG